MKTPWFGKFTRPFRPGIYEVLMHGAPTRLLWDERWRWPCHKHPVPWANTNGVAWRGLISPEPDDEMWTMASSGYVVEKQKGRTAMKITVINSTADAVNLLLFTKATRLQMSPGLLDEIKAWPEEKKAEELAYMAKTIPSSWEFVNITFLIEGISRACAQQLTRTRTASYAMQSQRVTDVRSMEVIGPQAAMDEYAERVWRNAVEAARDAYGLLVDDGFPAQDARGLLPMNTSCNIVAQYNLRSLVDLLKARASLRTQGEYWELAHSMRLATFNEWPWAQPFFEDKQAVAIRMLEEVAKTMPMTTGKGHAWEIAKAIDLLRKA